jgi:hypothetical protein
MHTLDQITAGDLLPDGQDSIARIGAILFQEDVTAHTPSNPRISSTIASRACTRAARRSMRRSAEPSLR